MEYIDHLTDRLKGIRYRLIINPALINDKKIDESAINIEHQDRTTDEKFINHKRYKKIRFDVRLIISHAIEFDSKQYPGTNFFIDYDKLRQ